jgi:hypothetical protein
MRCAFNEFTFFFAARSFDVFQNSHRVTSSRSENFFFCLSISLSRMKSTTKRKTVVAALLSFSVYLLCLCAYSLITFCRVVYLLRVGKSQRHNFEGEGTHFFFLSLFYFFFRHHSFFVFSRVLRISAFDARAWPALSLLSQTNQIKLN